MDKAERGDLVRVVRPDVASTDYKVGDIFEVKGRNFDTGDNGVHLTVGWPGNPEIPMFLFDSEYVIHRKAGEEDAQQESPGYKAVLPPRERILSKGQAQVLFEGKPFGDTQEVSLQSEETQADRIKRAGTELTELLVRKNHDYGDSFAKQYEKYGLMSALIRMDDKMRRLETLLAGTDAQVDESIKDTLLDLAGYALLASVEAGKRQGGNA